MAKRDTAVHAYFELIVQANARGKEEGRTLRSYRPYLPFSLANLAGT